MKKKYISLQEKRERKYRSRLSQVYEFEMQYALEEVEQEIDSRKSFNACNVIEAYGQQDLIIALKLKHIEDPSYWEIGIDSHFLDVERETVHTIPFYVELPAMSFVSLYSGMPDVWRGINAELIAHWEREGVPSGHTLVQSQVSMKAHAKFKNADTFAEYERLLKLRDQNRLISVLRMM